jgi:LPS-assembly protein
MPEAKAEMQTQPTVRPPVSMASGQPFLTVPDASSRAAYSEEPEASSSSMSVAPPAAPDKNKAPVDLQADDLTHNEETREVVARGHVRLVQSGRTLEADEIRYNLATDTASAKGNVVLTDANGDVHKADHVELTGDLKNGLIERLSSVLIDGSRFKAEEGEREGGTKTTMKDASYTPCEPCKMNPDSPPLWQLKASEVTHNEDEHSVEYKNARFEFMGVPLAYSPYLSHSDGTVKRKSGFLAPSAGYKSSLGGFMTGAYYYDIAPDKDATVGLRAFTRENPLLLGQYRQNWDNAYLHLDGGITYAGRPDKIGGEDVRQDEEVRGHIIGKGLWNINDLWRSGVNLEYASDDQYMRQYDFNTDDILENELYTERFSGRNYAVARVLTFQDIRIRDDQVDQPQVVPEMLASFTGEPGAFPVLGGRWDAEASFLGLRRSGNDQDVNRFSLGGGWQRRLISDTGLLTDIRGSLRGDAYSVRDRENAAIGSGRDRDTSKGRFFPQGHIETSYPLARPYENFQARIEPVVSLTGAPRIDRGTGIPNEDSQDIQVDSSNLFRPNRFPGYDMIEDGSRVTYGMRTGLYAYEGSSVRVFGGQSYRLSGDDDNFPHGSGLDHKHSDWVGEINADYKGRYLTNYKIQIDQDTLASERHEFDAYADWDRLILGGRYLYARGLEGTDIDESREQTQAAFSYKLDDNWRLSSGAIFDLGFKPGLRQSYAGLDYIGQCLSWSVAGERNLTDKSTGESSTEIMFRLGLKNLADLETAGFDDYLTHDLRP